jgi:hypothetical protein
VSDEGVVTALCWRDTKNAKQLKIKSFTVYHVGAAFQPRIAFFLFVDLIAAGKPLPTIFNLFNLLSVKPFLRTIIGIHV